MRHFSVLIISCFIAHSLPAQMVNNRSTGQSSQEIAERWSAFINAWHDEDAAQLAEFYIPDGRNIAPGGKIKQGREEIVAFYKGLFDANMSSSYSIEIESIDASGDLAVDYGTFHVHWKRNDGTEWDYTARSLTHWIRGTDGKWYIKTFMFNNPPAQ